MIYKNVKLVNKLRIRIYLKGCKFSNYLTDKSSTSKINEVKGGIIPVDDPDSPKAMSEGNMKSAFSPSCIKPIPSSIPLITCHC